MVAKAIADQNQRLQHTTTIYLHHQIAQYAKELTDRMPGNLKVKHLWLVMHTLGCMQGQHGMQKYDKNHIQTGCQCGKIPYPHLL